MQEAFYIDPQQQDHQSNQRQWKVLELRVGRVTGIWRSYLWICLWNCILSTEVNECSLDLRVTLSMKCSGTFPSSDAITLPLLTPWTSPAQSPMCNFIWEEAAEGQSQEVKADTGWNRWPLEREKSGGSFIFPENLQLSKPR